MKLWDALATCLLLLSSVATRPLHQNAQPAQRTSSSSSLGDSAEDEESASRHEDLQELSMEDHCKSRDQSGRTRPFDWQVIGSRGAGTASARHSASRTAELLDGRFADQAI